jgi:hypothetical protein
VAAGASNPLYALGRWATRFALAYAVASSLMAAVLGSCGVPVPDVLLAIPIQPGALADAVNKIATTMGPQPAAFLAGSALALFAVFNIFASLAFGVAKLFYQLAAALDPALIPFAALLGGLLQFSVYYYLLASVISGASGGG